MAQGTKHSGCENDQAPGPDENLLGSGTLYVVATPIGNLEDMTPRARATLVAVDLVAAEDTRHTRQLLAHFGIPAKLVSLHAHNESEAGAKLVKLLTAGQNVALVSDAGTPGISDPGAPLVAAAHAAGIRVVSIPGANAAVAALAASGFEGPFLFFGFLPAKTGARHAALESLASLPFTLLFYEAPHRILEAVADLAAVLGATRRLVIARELTKKFETIHACELGTAKAWLEQNADHRRGEFVLVVAGASAERTAALTNAEPVLIELLKELPLKQAVKLAVAITGAPRNLLYQRALELQAET
jgi:16S rRNA (cytidine1402-2'-O)-methyltransferase